VAKRKTDSIYSTEKTGVYGEGQKKNLLRKADKAKRRKALKNMTSEQRQKHDKAALRRLNTYQLKHGINPRDNRSK
tara:strand:- start:160 stop:387 length:228 start_codon:yes stop_codon:yes gene_type:complete